MKRRISVLTLCISLALLAGCSDQAVTTLESGAAPQFAVAATATATVLTFADLTPVGTSRLVRNDNGVSVALSTSGLTTGTTATLWMVVFNNPASCSPPACGEDDLFAPAVMADVMYTNGNVIGGSGKAGFAGHRREGDNGGSVFAALGLPAPGIIDSRMAEIHFVVRSHGPQIPRMMDEMIQTFNGGCQNPGPPFPDPLPPELGAAGPNTCVDVQFAMHLP